MTIDSFPFLSFLFLIQHPFSSFLHPFFFYFTPYLEVNRASESWTILENGNSRFFARKKDRGSWQRLEEQCRLICGTKLQFGLFILFFFFIRNYENYSKLILKRGGKRIIRLEMLFKNWIYIWKFLEMEIGLESFVEIDFATK